jgi:hypothetical protein
MEKLAIFVEGQTEEIFVTELIYQIADRQNVHIDSVCEFGGAAAGGRVFREVVATNRPDVNKSYYVIIYNSAGYTRVLSDIRDRYADLTSQHFKFIIGIRDVRPQCHADIPAIRANFDALTPGQPFKPLLVLATMEIEAWFIGECSHFPRIDARLTAPVVEARLGYNPETFDIEQRLNPVDDLRGVYMVAGRGYNKSRRHAEHTVRVLSYETVYLSLGSRFADLANLVAYLNGFFK